MPSTSRVLNTEVVFNIALDAAKSIDAPPREGGERAALVSVVFAAVSVEAFFNELVESAQDLSVFDNVPPAVGTFARLMSDLTKFRGPIAHKFQMAHWMLTGGPYDDDSEPFKELKLLFQVRNDLVHFKPDPLVEDGEPKPPHTTLEKLRSKNILNDSPAEDSSRSWIQSVGTRAVAEWACNASSLVTADLVSKLPEGVWRDEVEQVTRIIRTLHFPRSPGGVAT
jgi:hypothetical protein